MGVFGSSTKTYYNSTSCLLYEAMPSLVKQTVASSITQNRNIATDLVTNIANGVLFNSNRLYNYAKSGNYPWGLPDGTATQMAVQVYSYVEQVIIDEIGKQIELTYAVIDTDINTSALIYRAEYYEKDSNGNVIGSPIIWTYDESTGVYPTLDIIREDNPDVSPYYPIIPIYVDGQYTAESGQPNKLAVEQACRYLNIKPKDLSDAIEADPSYPDNPVEDAFIVMGLAVDDDSLIGAEYLYRFFNHMDGVSNVSRTDYDYWDENRNTPVPPINRITIEDSNYKQELGWLYIDDEIKYGTLLKPDNTLAKIGYYETEIELRGESDIPSTSFFYSADVLIIRKQITYNQYHELRVVGLVHSNWAVGKELRTTLTDVFKADAADVSQSFVIPLRKDIMRQMGNVKSHDLMYSSIRMVLNDKFVQKLKWYETEFFQIFITVIAIVISIVYPPAGVAAFSAAAAGIALINVIVMRLLLPIAYKALEDIVGEELAILVAVIAIAYGGNSLDYFNAFNFAVNKYQAIIFSDAMAEIQKQIDVLDEELEIIEEETADRQNDILMASRAIAGDPYAILESTNYVRRFKLEYKEPVLIRDTTERYTDMLRFTDKPDSYIRLGHTGY